MPSERAGCRLHKINFRRHQDFIAQTAGDVFLEAAQHAHVFHEMFLPDFHEDAQRFQQTLLFQPDEVVMSHFGEAHQHLFNLHGINVHALENEHVVRAAENAVDTGGVCGRRRSLRE